MIFPLAGNNKITPTVINILKEHRLPHAILIDGDIGTGRHTLAHYLCLAAVCSSESIPCGSCSDCSLANTKNHPDIRVIAPEVGKKNIAVFQIRDLKTDAYIKPHKSKTKVFIIDYADTLNTQAQNALLKILEEPPQNTVFILIAENKASLLDTVISRSTVFSLNVPSFNEAFEFLSKTQSFGKNDIENALTVSKNNIGKALKLLNGNDNDKIIVAVKEFLDFALRGDQWGMLCTLTPFEKSRVEAGGFFKELKLTVANEIKKNTASVRAAALLRFYNKLTEFEESLVTNISLSLLFAELTATAKEYIS